MSDSSPWTQSDWYALGSLFIRMCFLVAGVWFARNFLRTMRAFQEQIGALLKMSITSAPPDRVSPSTIAARSLGETNVPWLPITEPRTPTLLEPVEKHPSGIAAVWHGMIHWLNEPMRTSQVSYWRRMMNWLQAPVGS